MLDQEVTLHVAVTATDISVGMIQTYSMCPVARAVNRAYWLVGEDDVAKVGVDRAGGWLISKRGLVALPEDVWGWLEAYDSGCTVLPISFDLILPPAPVESDDL